MLLLVVLALWHCRDVRAAVTECGDSFLFGGYIRLCISAAVVCIVSWYLLLRRKAPLYISIGAAVFLLGLMNISVFRGLSAPDEVSHYISAYKISNMLLNTPVQDKYGQVYVRSCDLFLEDTEGRLDAVRAANDAGIEDFDRTLKIFGQELTEEVYRIDHEQTRMSSDSFDKAAVGLSCQWTVNTTPAAYVPQALGITLARMLGLGPVYLISLGKLFNLIFFTAAVMLALWLLPKGGGAVAGTALIPMTLHLGASMSYDVFVMAGSFVFMALIFNMIINGIRPVKALAAALVIALLAPCKLVYSLLLILLLLFVRGYLGATLKLLIKSRKAAKPVSVEIFGRSMTVPLTDAGRAHCIKRICDFLILASACIIFAAVSMYTINSTTIGNYAAADERIIEWAEEPTGYTFTYLLHHPFETADIFYRSILMRSGTWFSTMFGIYLGNQDPVLNVPYPVIGLYAVGLLIISAGSELALNISGKCITAAASVLIALALMASMLLAYTPVSAAYIEGVQGRYLLPVLPLIIMTMTCRSIRARHECEGVVLWSFIAAECYVLLRVYATVCLRIG